jgi:uncharacterized protein (DUF2235 family)
VQQAGVTRARLSNVPLSEVSVKRIVICADGTWNVRDQVDEETQKRRPSNVTKIARAVLPQAADGIDQVVCYDEGLGTGNAVDKFSGGAFGRGIEENIRQLYRFIVYNYHPGDELYFFGFSRGAFTVRSLAGFMNLAGLVQKDDDFYVPDIYGCYETSKRPGSPEWTKAFRKVKDTRPCPPIRCIGVFDTVGALGAPGVLGQVFNAGKYQYHDVGLNANIQHAYHALAIDERRKPFAPNLWTRIANWNGTLEQAWFAGAHTNVGGGCAPDGLANEALHWIVEKAEKLGLEFDNAFLTHYRACFNSVLRDSMSAKYRLFGEFRRPVGQRLADGEAIHQSAIDRAAHAESSYGPDNLKAARAAAAGVPVVTTTRCPRGTPC